MTLSLNDYGVLTHMSSVRRGFHTPRLRSLGESLCHAHDELAEVRRAFLEHGTKSWKGPDGKPEGMGSELADVILLCTEIAHIHGIDLDEAVAEKSDYNNVRP